MTLEFTDWLSSSRNGLVPLDHPIDRRRRLWFTLRWSITIFQLRLEKEKMILSKDKGIFKIETDAGARFQISELKVFQVFNNLDELMEYWSLPLQDGREYCIQPRTFNWKKSDIAGWRLIQILRDANRLRSHLSSQFRFPDHQWERICSIISKILPGPSDEFRLRNLIRTVIQEHGRPMFRDIVAAMVKARDAQFLERSVYQMLSSYGRDFVKFEVGVYGLAEWKSKGT